MLIMPPVVSRDSSWALRIGYYRLAGIAAYIPKDHLGSVLHAYRKEVRYSENSRETP